MASESLPVTGELPEANGNRSGRVRARYRQIAQYYDIVYRPTLAHGSRVLIGVRPIAPGERVLEIGAGTGFTLRHYPQGVRVTAVDLCPEMLAVAAAKRLPKARASVQLLTMDAHSLALRDGTFDVVLFPHSLGLMEDPQRVLADVARVTRSTAELRILHTFEWLNPVLRRAQLALYDFCEERLGWGRPLSHERTSSWCAKNGFELAHRQRLGWKTIAVYRKKAD